MLGKFTVGGELMLLGMGIVFLMLYLLSLILKAVGHYCGPKVEKNEATAPVQSVAAAKEVEDTNAKVAAVMAAIQAVMGDSEYRVVSIKPKDSSGWKSAIGVAGQEYNYGGKGK